MDLRPVGVFDSGLGGLTAVKRIVDLLPGEDIVYLGDTGRVPYGGRSRETIIRYAVEDTEFLCGRGIKALVVACGTVSTNAIDEVKSASSVPVFGVDATSAAVSLIGAGKMAGTIKQDAAGMAKAIEKTVSNALGGKTLLSGMDDYQKDETVDKLRINYAVYLGEEK